MTQTEIETIQNIIDRLSQPNCGCCNGMGTEKIVEAANKFGGGEHFTRMEVVSRLYLDSWVIPALMLLLPGDRRNPQLANKLSRP